MAGLPLNKLLMTAYHVRHSLTLYYRIFLLVIEEPINRCPENNNTVLCLSAYAKLTFNFSCKLLHLYLTYQMQLLNQVLTKWIKFLCFAGVRVDWILSRLLWVESCQGNLRWWGRWWDMYHVHCDGCFHGSRSCFHGSRGWMDPIIHTREILVGIQMTPSVFIWSCSC